MAEVPEVETIVRDLREALVGREILAAEVLLAAALRFPEPGAFVAQMAGRVILGAERCGKHILLPLSGDSDAGDPLYALGHAVARAGWAAPSGRNADCVSARS